MGGGGDQGVSDSGGWPNTRPTAAAAAAVPDPTSWRRARGQNLVMTGKEAWSLEQGMARLGIIEAGT
jgi:hypothetical protein